MARKPRSQRRKKGQGLGDEENGKNSSFNGTSNGKNSGNNNNGSHDHLSEDHTIADDSLTTAFSLDHDHDDFDDDGNNNDMDMDDLLAHGLRSTDQAEAAAAARDLRLSEILGSLDEFASEKRSAKREGRLKKLFKALSQYATGPKGWELVASHEDSLRQACLYSLRQSEPSEQYAACRCLEVISVLLGADQEAWVESVAKHLQRAVQITTKATAVRMAALRAWAMTVFICDTDEATTESLMDFCESVAAQPVFRNETTPLALRATAWDAWALLATSLETVYLSGQDDVQTGRGLVVLETLKECLDSPSVDLRSAAGECLCLIHEARLNLGCDDENHNDGTTTINATERRYRRGSWEGSSWQETWDEIQQRMAELAAESGRALSKRVRKQQRATFREFLATLLDDESPEEVVSFRNGAQLTLTTWSEVIGLNFLRHCLQSGFQWQLLTNETVQAILGADGRLLNAHSTGLSQLEKRLYLSKTSEAAKEAHLDRTKRRDKRQCVKNHFLTADGEEI